MAGQNPAPPKNPWNDDSLVNTNRPWCPMVSKWCRILSIHGMARVSICRLSVCRLRGLFVAIRWGICTHFCVNHGEVMARSSGQGESVWNSRQCSTLPYFVHLLVATTTTHLVIREQRLKGHGTIRQTRSCSSITCLLFFKQGTSTSGRPVMLAGPFCHRMHFEWGIFLSKRARCIWLPARTYHAVLIT